MSLQFMEGFETAITGNDYIARGVLRLSSFEINSQPQGRNGGMALGRQGDSNGANTSPRSTTTSTDPYVVKVTSQTVNQLWNTGGAVISIWSQYKDTTPVYGISPQPGGGVYLGTVDTLRSTNSNMNVLVTSTTDTPIPSATGTILRVSNGKVMQTDPNGSGYFRGVNETTVTTVADTVLGGNGGFVCFDYNGSRYVGVGRSSASTSGVRFIAYSDDLSSWTVVGPTGSGTNYPLNIRWLSGPNVWIAVGLGGILWRSVDGITWTTLTNPGGTATLYDVATDGTNIVAVGANVVLQSTNAGVTWTLRSNPIASTTWSSVASSGTRFVIANAVNGNVAYSTNGGLDWTVGGTAASATQVASLAWDGTQFVKGSDNNIEYSTDALLWRIAMRYVTTLNGPAPNLSSNAGYWLIPGIAQSNGTITVPDGNAGYTTMTWGGNTWYYFNSGAVNTGISTPAKNTWFNVKFLLTPTTTTNRFSVTGYVDGSQIFSIMVTWTGTQNLWFALPNTGINFHDDLVVTDFSGDHNVGDLGDVHIVAKFPSSDVQAEWERVPGTLPSNAAAVNAGALSLSTSHVEVEASGSEDRYNTTLKSTISGLRPLAVQTEAYFSRLDVEQPFINLGTTLGDSTTRTPNIQLTSTTGTITYVSQLNDTDPNGQGWTNQNIENVGVSIQKV